MPNQTHQPTKPAPPKRTPSLHNNLLTVEQVADMLQISQSSVRSYIRSGTLRGYRVAGKRKVLITREAAMGLLQPARPELEP